MKTFLIILLNNSKQEKTFEIYNLFLLPPPTAV